jgi:Mrp family chromosome partitioning ATPase
MSMIYDATLRASQEGAIFNPSVAHPTIRTEEPRECRVLSTAGRPKIHIDPRVHDEEMKLIQRVFLLPKQEAPRAVVICGTDDDNGAAGICARAGENLGAQTGLPVCLVDANLHSSGLRDYFGVGDDLSIVDSGVGSIRSVAGRLAGDADLSLVRAGATPADTCSPWNSDSFARRLIELREAFCYVLVYAPPANLYMDASVLGQLSDGLILVLESSVSRRETARKAKENLAAANVNILGAVLNNRTFPIPERIYRML